MQKTLTNGSVENPENVLVKRCKTFITKITAGKSYPLYPPIKILLHG